MKAKKQKNGIKVLISLVIALTMVSIPASVFVDAGDGNNDSGAIQGTADVLYGETGTPPYAPNTYSRNEDNRYNGTASSDPYSGDRGVRDIPPDVDVTYLNEPDPTTAHVTADQNVVATVTNWDDVGHNVKIILQVYKEMKFDPVKIWGDDMESCCVNWTAVDGDGDGVTWGRTEVRSNSPTHSWHNVYDCTQGTYVGNSNDSLISREINIPKICDGKKPGYLWLDFKQWIQGEESEDSHKFEDYGNVYYKLDDGPWRLVASYRDSSGEWLGSDPANSSITALTWSPWGIYDYDSDHNPLGWRIPITPDNKTLQIRFQWISDPAIQYEGWYIDDVAIYAQCGGLQQLVWQEYKPSDHSLYLEPFNAEYPVSEDSEYTAPFQKMVQFELPFTPEEDTTYFFEVYSEIVDELDPYGNAVIDIDGHYDYNGDNATTFPTGTPAPGKPDGWFIDPMTGATYWNPLNGVNESVYFGTWHDGQADWIQWDVPTPMVELSGSSVDIPISAQVSNQGTVTEPIPYTIEVKKTEVNFLQKDNIEKGDTDYYINPDNWPDENSWGMGYFDNPDALKWQITDMDYSSPTHAWYSGVPIGKGEGVYPSDQWNAIRTPYFDLTDYVALGIDVGLSMDMSWSFDPTLNPGYKGHYSDHGDAIIFGTWDPVNNLWLHLSSTEVSGYQPWKSFSINEIFGMYGGWSDSGEIKTLNDLASAHRNIMIAIGYKDPGYKVAIMFSVMTDASGVGYPGKSWGGFLLDNVYAYSVATGETVWSMDGVTEPLEPGEHSDTINAMWEAKNYCDYTAVITTHVDNDWNTHFKNNPDFGYMYNDEAITWDSDPGNIYIHKQLYDEDFEGNEPFVNTGEFSLEWSKDDNTFGHPGNWTVVSDGAPGWQENHYVWTGDGTDSVDSTYMNGMDDVLIPKDPVTGGIQVFNWSGQESLYLNFSFWQELETGTYPWDIFLVEVSNDSGQNWWMLNDWWNKWVWPTMHNESINVEGWMDMNLTLYDETTPLMVIDPLLGPAFEMGLTKNMTFRFHFNSDSNTGFKGAFVDNVKLVCITNKTVPYDGTDKPWELVEDVQFEDDFENGLDKWLNINEYTGSMWHISDTCGYPDDAPGEHSAANFDPYPWSSYDLDWLGYSHNYGYYRNKADDKLVLDLDLSQVYQAWLTFKANYSFADAEDIVTVEISDDNGGSWHELNRYMYTSGGWINQTSAAPLGFDLIDDFNYGIDISDYAGQPVLIRWRLISNETGVSTGFQLDNVVVTGKIDNEPPVTTAILGPATPDGCNGWYVSDVTVTLNAVDREMGETYYSIDGGAWLLYTGPITIGIEGEHTIGYYSVDAVGNVETAKSVSFKIDKTAPTGSITTPQAGYIYFFGRELMPRILVKDKALIIGGLTATATASDSTSGVAYVTFSTGAGTGEDAVSPYEYNLPFYLFKADTLTVTVTDNACNTANIGSVDYFKVF